MRRPDTPPALHNNETGVADALRRCNTAPGSESRRYGRPGRQSGFRVLPIAAVRDVVETRGGRDDFPVAEAAR
jgi:hypothetical protein